MNLLTAHIVISALSIFATGWLIFVSTVDKSILAKYKVISAVALTFSSVISGVFILFQGASIGRVCAESFLLITATVGLVAYQRKIKINSTAQTQQD